MYIYIDIYMHVYMYIRSHVFQGVVRPCRWQRTTLAQSQPGCATGRWLLPWRCHGKSQIRLPAAAPGKDPPFTAAVRL